MLFFLLFCVFQKILKRKFKSHLLTSNKQGCYESYFKIMGKLNKTVHVDLLKSKDILWKHSVNTDSL